MTKKALLVYYTGFYSSERMQLDNFSFFKNDAIALGTLLKNKGWDNEYLTDPLANKSTITETLNHLSSNSTDDGLLLFYFIGHGIKENGFYLVTYTSLFLSVNNKPLLEFLSGKEYGDMIISFLKDKPDRVFITIIDACYSGMISKSISEDVTNHWLVTSSTEFQLSHINPQSNNTYFFDALISSESLTPVLSFIKKIKLTMENARSANTPILKISTRYHNMQNPI